MNKIDGLKFFGYIFNVLVSTLSNLYIVSFIIYVVFLYFDFISKEINNYILVLMLGFLFSGIELASSYKDEPINAINSLPGIIYLLVNGFICCFGYFIIITFSLNVTVSDVLSSRAQVASDILLASMTSFLIMRSSFLTLGGENNQVDLGLSVIIKKLILIVDRQVDRYQASSRAKDITEVLKYVSLWQLEIQVFPLCLQVMQNVSKEELNEINEEFERFKIFETQNPTKEEEDAKKLSAGLMLYSLVGKKVLETAISQLSLEPDKKMYQESKNNETYNSEFINKESVKDAALLDSSLQKLIEEVELEQKSTQN